MSSADPVAPSVDTVPFTVITWPARSAAGLAGTPSTITLACRDIVGHAIHGEAAASVECAGGHRAAGALNAGEYASGCNRSQHGAPGKRDEAGMSFCPRPSVRFFMSFYSS